MPLAREEAEGLCVRANCLIMKLCSSASAAVASQGCSPEYDGVKSLLGLMWSVFTGWNWSDGYSKKDVIAELIEAI